LKHGERVEILETRRRFVRVRAANGAVGWTDSELLLTQTQIDDLKALSQQAAAIPSQGTGTVFDALNMHTAPSRTSPNILQLKAGEKITVVAHKISPRIATVPVKSVTIERPKPEPPPKKKGKTPDLPLASPPPLPEDWRELSRPRVADLTEPEPVAAPRVAPADDWFLVRTADGVAGWVLMRQVLMQVPDDVAQYAERQLITSYHALGETTDAKGELKNHWLWTTSVKGSRPYDFDSYRVFVWAAKRQRYETVAIDRNLKGYFPVEKTMGPDGITFSLLVEDKDGQLQKRTYLFKDLHAKLISKVPTSLPKPLPEVRPATSFDALASDESWIVGLRKKWFGR